MAQNWLIEVVFKKKDGYVNMDYDVVKNCVKRFKKKDGYVNMKFMFMLKMYYKIK